ncbi:MAG: hypothetical protein ACSHXY_07555 [Alphaproteobacteria bacterium]
MQVQGHFDKKIVVIDHNPDFLTAMKALLYQAGYMNVTGFEHSDDAHAFIKACHNDIYKTYINLMLYPQQGPVLLEELMKEDLSPVGFTMMSDFAPIPQRPIYYTSADISQPIIKPHFRKTFFESFEYILHLEMAYIHQRKLMLAPTPHNDADLSQARLRREVEAALAMNIPITNAPPTRIEKIGDAAIAGVTAMTIHEVLTNHFDPNFIQTALPEITASLGSMLPLIN